MTQETKQTAVDWYAELSSNQFMLFQEGHISISEFKNRMSSIKIKAKEMEKERIIKAYDEDLYGGLSGNRKFKDGKEYYEFTYGGNK